MTSDQKREYWSVRIGMVVDAANYRGERVTGTLLAVDNGVWGYGGDSVALRLNVRDGRGLNHWPAGACVAREN